jgi:hypothetical protein
VAFADLGVRHGMIVITFPGNKSSETFTTTVNEIEPQVIGEWPMPIGAFGVA